MSRPYTGRHSVGAAYMPPVNGCHSSQPHDTCSASVPGCDIGAVETGVLRSVRRALMVRSGLAVLRAA